MTGMNDEAWIKANIEVVDNYLKGEFVNFTIAHHADNTRNHIFTVNNRKKRFTLSVGWSIFVDKHVTQAGMDRKLNKEQVAEAMRLHGEDGYHWTPSHEDTIQPDGL